MLATLTGCLCIVFDEMQAGGTLILSNKKMMQAHVDGARVGQSATQKWAHEVNLWRVALICRP